MKDKSLPYSLIFPLIAAFCITPASAQPLLTNAVIVPFSVRNDHILFTAAFDGLSGTYVFDTGAPAVVLNAEYVRAGKGIDASNLDTVPEADRARNRARRGDQQVREAEQSPVTLHRLSIGTFIQKLAPTDVGPPKPWISSNATLLTDSRFDGFDQPVFGSFGLSAMEPFEIVIDFPKRQLIFIRLDAAGHPLAKVPHHTLAGRVPLVPVLPDQIWWGVDAQLGTKDVHQVLTLDTGGAYNFLPDETLTRLVAHLSKSVTTTPSGAQMPRYVLDHLIVGSRTVDSLDVRPLNDLLLGYPFMVRLGVVGFNFRARQFSWYN